MFINMEDIVITNSFKAHTPKSEKLEYMRQYYNNYKTFDKPITVVQYNGKYKLIDGYVRYLIALENNLTIIGATVLAKTKYFVYARHPENSKVYCWRVPNSSSYDEFIQNVKQGDKILVHTSKGKKIVMVDSITSDEPSFNVNCKLASSKIIKNE